MFIGTVQQAARRGARFAFALAASALAAAVLSQPAATFAQSRLPAHPDPGQPVALVADRIAFDGRARTVTAEGSVEVRHGDRTLTADRIVYHDGTGRITAEGALVLRDPTGATIHADAADIDADLRDGIVAGARAILAENVRLAAVESRRVDGRYNALSKVVYSPCRVCTRDPTPLWRIRARRVIHDEERRIIHYENATFDVLGVPIAWLPYFRHPDPTVKRASGFLTPEFLSYSTFGYAAKIPYHWVIDDQSDLTLQPFVTTNDGLIVEGEYRRAFESGALALAGSVSRHDHRGASRTRGHVDSDGRFRVGSGIAAGWDVNVASDDGYLRRFDFDHSDRLTSEAFVERYGSDGFFDASAIHFQSLRDNEPAGLVPKVLPVLDARRNLEGVAGGVLGLFLSGYTLVRSNGRDASRLSLGIDWEREAILPPGIALAGFAEARGDVFLSEDDPSVDGFTARVVDHVGVEARVPLIRDGESSDLHIVEPVAQVVLAPNVGNDADIPFEDSLLTEFDETNLIDRNRFSGLDHFEEGARLNLALRYQGSIGAFDVDASGGRVYRLRSAPGFTANSGLAAPESDFVAFWQARHESDVWVSQRLRFSDDATVARNEIFGTLSIDPLRLVAGYAFFESDPSIGADIDREEVSVEAAVRIDRNWSTRAFAQRELQLGEFVRVGGQITYENECCAIDAFLQRRFTASEDAPASTSIGIRIRLLTLGGSNDL